MEIYFNVDYATAFGEELLLNILSLDANGDKTVSPLRMSNDDGQHWHCRLHRDDNDAACINYFYSVSSGAGSNERHEWLAQPHQLELNAARAKKLVVYDHWIDIPEDSYLYSSAFTDCLGQRQRARVKRSNHARTVTLKVRAPQLRSNDHLAIVGSSTALGAWRLSRAISMTEHACNEWMVDIDAAAFEVADDEPNVTFKFVCINEADPADVMWETCDNRQLDVLEMQAAEQTVYELDQAFFPIYNRRVAGTLVPVFSLRTKGSFGVGDFGDLRLMIDYVAATGQRVLQVLPINDTTTTGTWIDSYPYSCISVFALHPQYVDLRQLPELKDAKLRERMEALREELNALPQIDYERVNHAKNDYLHALYKQEGKRVMATAAYRKFIKANEQWLIPYAQFCHLRDTYATADTQQWPDHQQWDEQERQQLSEARTPEHAQIAYYLYVQYVLCSQMSSAHDYAREKGVILKGDIPIGVSRYGCDVWTEPRYFNMNSQAGAPPDDFSVNGQNWGFPTYNWQEMLRDDCAWWVRRFKNMANYFDAYRIDHVLGFFRIWDIPLHSVHGLLGQFSPALGMSREEIEAYGLKFQEELFTRPFIADWVLSEVFGPHASYVRDKFLDRAHDDIYQLKPEYDTQRKIEAFFRGKTSKEDVWIRDGLYALVSDVLFLRDNNDNNKFHPRITAQFNFMYRALWDSDKAIFNKIYNDYYYRRNNQFWYREAMKKLPRLVEATRMLVCAEDLGMVPDCVPWVMNQLRILSLEIQSMPKNPKVRFGILQRNPYRSVCTIASHDMPTLRQWWDEDWQRTQDYYNNSLYHEGSAPHPLTGQLAEDIIARHLASPSMLAIISIQDWLAIDEQLRLADQDAERINIPANPHHYWRYRMHLNIEDIMTNEHYMRKVSSMIANGGRTI